MCHSLLINSCTDFVWEFPFVATGYLDIIEMYEDRPGDKSESMTTDDTHLCQTF